MFEVPLGFMSIGSLAIHPRPAHSSRGEQEKRARKARLKCAASLKPHENAISLTLRAAKLGSHKSRRMASKRRDAIHSAREHASPAQARCKVLGDTRNCNAMLVTVRAGSRDRDRDRDRDRAHALICSRR